MPRGLKYRSVADLQAAIDDYFASCEGKTITDENGAPILYKGLPVQVNVHPATVTGLAYALGFKSRQALLNYQGRPAFHDAITRAKMRIEAYTEERLFDRDGVNGAKFSLTNNFSGWSATGENSQTGELREDGLSRSLRALAQELENDD